MDNQEEVHEVYGAEIPYESDMDSDISITLEAQNSMNQELESVKKKVKEAEEELANLRKRQAEMKKRAQDQDDSVVASKEVDARSIYVGNLDYACSAEEVLEHFLSCGTINRVTILSDMFGHPKGYAYVEFDQVEAVQKALRLNETQLHARKLKVSAKRTNLPGMAQFRGRHPNVYSGGYGKDLGTWSPMRFHPY